MTRTADVDLASPEHADVTEDLEARSRLSNQLKAEVFVSIHHNSNTNDPQKNDTEIYYKLADPGPSQDLANCMADALRKGRSISNVHIFPGNYSVLRKTEAIGILGEASFISNRENETRLSLSNQLRNEAEDYFLGILSYFQKGIPEVTSREPDGVTIDNAFPHIEATVKGGPDGHTIDPVTTRLILDGTPVPAPFDLTFGKLSFVPDTPLTNGEHTFVVQARNNNGNAVWEKPALFCVSLPPAEIKVFSPISALPADGESSSPIEVTVLDRYGNAVISGTLVTVAASSGTLDTESISTVSGKGFAYFTSPRISGKAIIEAVCQGFTGKTEITCGTISYSLLRIKIKDLNNNPIESVCVKGEEGPLGITDGNGLAFIRSYKSTTLTLTLVRPGYESLPVKVLFERGAYRKEEFSLTPREDGVLLRRKFTLDPEPWNEHAGNDFDAYPDREKANFIVAQELQTLLGEAGAVAVLTRTSPHDHLSPGERVLRGEQFGGEYFITIAHRKDASSVAHYFRSRMGKKLADSVAQVLNQQLHLKNISPQEGADYTITQPSSPSIVINAGEAYLTGREQPGEELLTREAQGIYEGIVRFLKQIENSGNSP
jgi:N-acetylmuramoyl-L-alanine amidase